MKVDKEDIYIIISNTLEIDLEIIKYINENNEFEIYGMTSVSAMQLLINLEEKYNFEFKDEDLLINKFNTLKKLFCLLENY